MGAMIGDGYAIARGEVEGDWLAPKIKDEIGSG